MPAVLTVSESAQDRAVTYYATKAILDSECRGVDFDVRLRVLGRTVCQDFIAGWSITDFNAMYDDQLEDPSRFAILSYHDRMGTVINDTCVPNTMVLKPTGDSVTALAAVDRRDPHVKFATYQVHLDFKELWRENLKNSPLYDDHHYDSRAPSDDPLCHVQLLRDQRLRFRLYL